MSAPNKALEDPTSGLPPVLAEDSLGLMLDVDELAATAQHIENLNRKINALNAARVASWNQLLTAMGRVFDDGEIDGEGLYKLLYAMADSYGAGYTRVWDRNAPVLARHVVGQARSRDARTEAEARNRPNGPHGTWNGALPLPVAEHSPLPIKGIAVVYVLYDAENEPVYHGSTDHLRARLRRHEQEKPEAVQWVASRCDDREHAYQVEVANLRQHLPRLNKKASR